MLKLFTFTLLSASALAAHFDIGSPIEAMPPAMERPLRDRQMIESKPNPGLGMAELLIGSILIFSICRRVLRES